MVIVSVIMLSYNHEKYISEAIDSVLNQTFKDFELIIVDDCSKDNSKEIIKNYQRKDERIRAFFHKSNRGIAYTANHGIAEAKGKFLALSASDDVWLESKLERQLSVLNADESLIVWSEGEIIDANGIPTGTTFAQIVNAGARHPIHQEVKSGNLFEALLYGNFIFGSSAIFKRDLVEDIRFCEELKYYNDYKFFVDLSRNHSFYFIPEPLARYRVHGKNTNKSDRESWLRDEIIFGGLILREYGSSIPQKLKADLLLRIGYAHSHFGNKAAVRKNYFRAIGLDPFRKGSLFFLISALAHGDDSTAKFFIKLRHCLRFIIDAAKPISSALRRLNLG